MGGSADDAPPFASASLEKNAAVKGPNHLANQLQSGALQRCCMRGVPLKAAQAETAPIKAT